MVLQNFVYGFEVYTVSKYTVSKFYTFTKYTSKPYKNFETVYFENQKLRKQDSPSVWAWIIGAIKAAAKLEMLT